MRNAAIAASIIALAASSAAAETGSVPLSADELLAPYYAKLEKQISLPVAQPNVSLARTTNLTRVAFGSCNHQSRHQTIWAQIAAKNPDMFLFIGDNNYGDQGWNGDASLSTLRAAYATMAKTPELADFRSKVPMMVTWDDHDFGFNDGGANFAFRGWSETIFETFWGSSNEVRSRPGVYESVTFGEAGKRTQIITLDTRFFRSDFERMEYTPKRPPLGSYVPSSDPSKTMLGGAQWAWLKQELAKPADLRILVSSIQVVTDAHNYEAWESMPAERTKLYSMLGARADSGLVLLSGDRHGAGIYKEQIGDETVWELTSSSLNYSFASTAQNTKREPDAKRVTDFISEENFGTVEIDWNSNAFTMMLYGNKGEERASQTVKF
ncbi:MAG: alkaline phosphatase D family protein [Marinomonas sp.]